MKKILISILRFFCKILKKDIAFKKYDYVNYKLKKILDNKRNYIIKNRDLDDLLKNNPNNYKILLAKANLSYLMGEIDFTSYFRKYNDARNKFIKSNNLNKFELIYLKNYLFTGALGNCLAFINLVNAQKLNLLKNKSFFTVFSNSDNLTNKALFEYFVDYIDIIDENIIDKNNNNNFLEHLEYPLGSCFPSDKECLPLYCSINQINYIKNSKKELKPYEIKKNHFDYGNKILKQLKISTNDWYVCLHVREGATYNETIGLEDYRNADINNFINAIKFITNQGGYVFRLGDKKMKPLPKMKNVIDYAISDFKSEEMDIFLGSTCKFLITTATGFWPICSMFNVPVFLSNSTQSSIYYALDKKDYFIPKRIYKLVNGKKEYLYFESLFEQPFFSMYSYRAFDFFKNSEYYFENNTSDEIYESVKYIYFNLKNKIEINNLEKTLVNRITSHVNKKFHLEMKPLATIPEPYIKSIDVYQKNF